jgi:hypothetical protein
MSLKKIPRKRPKPRKRRPKPLPCLLPSPKDRGGRPKGTLKRFPFSETRLGFMLRHETPTVFDLIVELSPIGRKRSPHPTLISAVCSASKDPAFDKPKFRAYLEEYVRNGVYCKRGKKLTPERERYYERIRRNKLQKYIRLHRAEIEELREALSACTD